MVNCKYCEKPYWPNKPWQVFCCFRCQQDWHLQERKLSRQTIVEMKVANGHQQETVGEVLRRMKQGWKRKCTVCGREFVAYHHNHHLCAYPCRDAYKLQQKPPEEMEKAREVLARFIEAAEDRRREPKVWRRM